MTIHQSKGLEFPVTCVGSLTRNPKKAYTDLDAILEEKYFHRELFEPLERIKNFDFWREYYVAFSRPQNLLVLTSALDKKGRLGKTFDDITADVPEWTDKCFTSRALHLETVKKTMVKNDYAFTSDILLYENCPTQYMAFKYFGFALHRVAATMFGSLVHETIEDVHKTFLRGVIDLVRGDGDTVEIVDFKTDRKPDVNNPDDRKRLSNYQRQLQVYARIVEKKFGKKVSKLHLYYTRAEGESPYVSWPASVTSVEKTIRSFDEVVAKIESYQFSNKNVKKCAQLCDNCDMRFYRRFK